MDNWWKKQEIVEQITDWAFSLNDRASNQRVLSLGQSPSWIVACLSMIRKIEGRAAGVTYVPFTGAFLKRDKNNCSERMEFNIRYSDLPKPDQINTYFNFLGLLEAQPQQILNSNDSIILAEMIKGGNGLTSFMNLWLNFLEEDEREKFKQYVETHIYDTAPSDNRDEILLEAGDTFKLERIPLNSRQAEIIEGITPLNIAEKSSSRLVPIYRLSARYEAEQLTLIPNLKNRKEIKVALHEEVQRTLQRHETYQRMLRH